MPQRARAPERELTLDCAQGSAPQLGGEHALYMLYRRLEALPGSIARSAQKLEPELSGLLQCFFVCFAQSIAADQSGFWPFRAKRR